MTQETQLSNGWYLYLKVTSLLLLIFLYGFSVFGLAPSFTLLFFAFLGTLILLNRWTSNKNGTYMPLLIIASNVWTIIRICQYNPSLGLVITASVLSIMTLVIITIPFIKFERKGGGPLTCMSILIGITSVSMAALVITHIVSIAAFNACAIFSLMPAQLLVIHNRNKTKSYFNFLIELITFVTWGSLLIYNLLYAPSSLHLASSSLVGVYMILISFGMLSAGILGYSLYNLYNATSSSQLITTAGQYSRESSNRLSKRPFLSLSTYILVPPPLTALPKNPS